MKLGELCFSFLIPLVCFNNDCDFDFIFEMYLPASLLRRHFE